MTPDEVIENHIVAIDRRELVAAVKSAIILSLTAPPDIPVGALAVAHTTACLEKLLGSLEGVDLDQPTDTELLDHLESLKGLQRLTLSTGPGLRAQVTRHMKLTT